MTAWPEDYIENVVKDVEKYNGVRKVVRASLFERCAIKKCNPLHLHPNPTDEFSMPAIGPNMEIVGEYVKQIDLNRCLSLPIFEDPLIVQKMEPDGYLLLNGHHRWFAAVRMKVKKIHVRIVNLTNENDLNRMINRTGNDKLVSFDLDEVLLSEDENNQSALTDTLLSKKIKERLRAGAPEVIREFAKNGYDICVYTAGYLTEDDFEDLFSMYDLKIDIVVNGINEKRKKTSNTTNNFREMIRNKYKHIVHVDNEAVVCMNRITQNYDVHEIDKASDSWSEGIKAMINKL